MASMCNVLRVSALAAVLALRLLPAPSAAQAPKGGEAQMEAARGAVRIARFDAVEAPKEASSRITTCAPPSGWPFVSVTFPVIVA